MPKQVIRMSFTKRIILSFFFLCSTITYAQKVKKEGLGYFNYKQPRASTLLDSAQVYTLHISTQEGGSFRKDIFLEELKVPVFSLIEDRNRADFMLSIEELPFKFEKEKKKSISGGENGATSYFYAGTINYHYLFKVLNPDGEEVFRKIARGSVKTSGRSSTSLTDAHRNYVKDKNKFKENCAKKASESFTKIFADQFTDLDKTVHLRATYIKEKKFKYAGYNKAYSDLLELYESLNMSTTPTEKEHILKDNCISFWTEFSKEVEPENKKARVTIECAGAAHYNMGLVHFFCGEFALATSQFEIALSYDKTVVAGIMNWIYISKTCSERLANH